MNFSFRPHERLHRSEDIRLARRQGRKRVGRFLILWALRRRETPPHPCRFGVLVSRKDGGAVQRNRFKRRMREIFRLNKWVFPRGWDLLAAPKRGAVPSPDDFPAGSEDLKSDFLELSRPVIDFSKSAIKTEVSP